MPIWSILNHCLDLPSQEEKDAPHLYIHTMTGPCWCVHCAQKAVLETGSSATKTIRSSPDRDGVGYHRTCFAPPRWKR